MGVVVTAVPEPANRVWKEVLSASYSSSTSGNWSWDASDQSVPSTPSPPLSNDTAKNFLLSSPGDDVSEDGSESAHFMFEEPVPRKRKVRHPEPAAESASVFHLQVNSHLFEPFRRQKKQARGCGGKQRFTVT